MGFLFCGTHCIYKLIIFLQTCIGEPLRGFYYNIPVTPTRDQPASDFEIFKERSDIAEHCKIKCCQIYPRLRRKRIVMTYLERRTSALEHLQNKRSGTPFRPERCIMTQYIPTP